MQSLDDPGRCKVVRDLRCVTGGERFLVGESSCPKQVSSGADSCTSPDSHKGCEEVVVDSTQGSSSSSSFAASL